MAGQKQAVDHRQQGYNPKRTAEQSDLGQPSNDAEDHYGCGTHRAADSQYQDYDEGELGVIPDSRAVGTQREDRESAAGDPDERSPPAKHQACHTRHIGRAVRYL